MISEAGNAPRRGPSILAHAPFNNRRYACNLLRFTALAGVLALLAIVVAGCGIFDPKKSGGKPPPLLPVYDIPIHPTVVLSNLVKAYSARDSVGYKALYDSSYVGTSQDLRDPPGTTPISLTYADEVAHVARLASKPTITSAYMDLGPPTSWTRLESDDPSHPEWAVIQIAGSSLTVRVTEGNEEYLANGTSEFFEFAFKPTTPASISSTDTLWNIVRWKETRAAGP